MASESSGRGARDRPARPRYVLDQPGGNLALDLFVLDQHLGAMLDAAFARTDVTPSQYAVYAQLARGARTPGQLRTTLGLRPATLSGHLSALEARGHLLRTTHSSDGRSALLTLTDDGRAVHDTCRTMMRRAVKALRDEIGSSEETDAIRAALGRLDEAMLSATTSLRAARKASRSDRTQPDVDGDAATAHASATPVETTRPSPSAG